jgi:tRNA-specific 2-thiouridylase
MKKKVAVLCSGGVDSSVALASLVHEGYDVTAFYLKIWLEDELSYLSDCPWQEDIDYIKKTASLLGVSYEIIPFQKEYHERVVTKAVAMIKEGFTPNPDIFCNTMIKFGVFYDLFASQFDYIATGHYAKVSYDATLDWYFLEETADRVKDQTYFLSYINAHLFRKVLFPLGDFSDKSAVREYAQKVGLPSACRPDSQGICFLGKIPFKDFIAHHCGIQKGPLINYDTGRVEGEHNGFWFFTIGQRQGIGLSGGPWYVVGKEDKKNIVYISNKKEATTLPQDLFVCARSSNILVPRDLCADFLRRDGARAKVRHGKEYLAFSLQKIEDKGDTFDIEIIVQGVFGGLADGQIITFYSKEGFVIAAGIIAVLSSVKD